MMATLWIHLIALGLIQGLTEFLPVSSSAHLVLLPKVMEWPDQGITWDVAAHMGTLGAVLLHFRQDMKQIVCLCFSFVKRCFRTGSLKNPPVLPTALLLGTLPAICAGVAFHGLVESVARSLVVIGSAACFFGTLMFLADRFSPGLKSLQNLQGKHALWIGLAQALSIIPGASRSGVTVTMARFLGYTRKEAFRFSFLLGVPVMLGAGVFETVKACRDNISLLTPSLLLMMVISFGSGLLGIRLMMFCSQRFSLTPFFLYRLILGASCILGGYFLF